MYFDLQSAYLGAKMRTASVCSNEPVHDKTNKMTCVPSTDISAWASAQFDQSDVRFMGSKGPKALYCGQERLIRLIRLGRCPG